MLSQVNSMSAERLDNAPRPAVAGKVADKFRPARLDHTQMTGLLGDRLTINLTERLLRDVDPQPFLAGFQKRPGSHPWIGEHIGKYLHAACNVWAYGGNQPLRAKIDPLVTALIATQEGDGYLGTYAPDKRFALLPGADWDVWVHKYCLIGLLSYYRTTGHAPSLQAARRVGDLLCSTFGDEAGKRDIIRSGTHVGMAPASVLEPMALLYRYTGEKRYLDFCLYVTRAYEQPHGPKIISSLLEKKNVYRTANGKAYEMMSNLVGLCDLYRLTGERRFLDPALNAWEDIVANRLYLTGTTSSDEHFKDDHFLPGGAADHVGETCATVTWMQLTLQLLRLLGETRFADELERTIYNHLLGAQHPREGTFCYFTPLYGKKPYQAREAVTCCQSSGPRGISLIPAAAWGWRKDGIVVWLYTPGRAIIDLSKDLRVELVAETDFPLSGKVTLTVKPTRAAEFPVYLRVPSWCSRFVAEVGKERFTGEAGWPLEIRRTWQPGDRIEIDMDMTVRVLGGGPTYGDSVAVQRGPQVLAIDAAVNPDVRFLNLAAPASVNPSELGLRAVRGSKFPDGWAGHAVFEINGIVRGKKAEKRTIRLVPFADAGQLRTPFRVWLPRPDRLPTSGTAVTAFGRERWSRPGNVDGSICDELFDTFRVTFDGKSADLDWYEVEMDQPGEIARVVFAHGKNFNDGGWFDTSGGKPQVQVRRAADAPWQTVATLDSYPQTDATHIPRLQDGQKFEVALPKPISAVAVRVIGKPACGDKVGQAFSSCAELQAFANE